jgi:acyl dehydratase
MPFDYDKLINFNREIEQAYTVRDTILYALGVGAGIDAATPAKLRYVYEEHLEALPTMSSVLAAPGFWQREPQFGISWKRILHGEQSIVMRRPLPVAGVVTSTVKVDEIYDKGADKGALVYTSRSLYNKASGDLLATIRQSSFLRGDGGAGGRTEGGPKPHAVPEGRPADLSVTLATRAEQALIYRLSGDYNPLHADPATAVQGGFKRPILHGLATYGIVGRALVSALCDDHGARLNRMDVRFSSPVYPGESITTQIWREGPGRAGFKALVAARATLVLDNGYAEYEEE